MTKDKLVIATKNAGKAAEFRTILKPKGIKLLTLADFGNLPEIEENGQTFLENARIKAETIAKLTNLSVLADDSGLMVDALNGEPGVHSARYAGDHDDVANNAKLLANLAQVPDEERTAKFHTTLVLVSPNGHQLVSEGEVRGKILTAGRGENGFGYDPLFYVPELNRTMAELSATEKKRH